jgi:hypothetical protein
MRVLADSVEPMRTRDIQTEVEALVGQPVSRSAVKNWLANHACGKDSPLVRISRGRYRLTQPQESGQERSGAVVF